MKLSTLRIVALLLLCLAGALFVVSRVVTLTTMRWFERDLALRAQLAIAGARSSLIEHADEPARIKALFEAITHDERILAVALCDAHGDVLVASRDYPKNLHGPSLGVELGDEISHRIVDADEHQIQISAVPLATSGTATHALVVHDLSFVLRRQDVVDRFLLTLFVAFAVCGILALLIGSRLSFRAWTARLRSYVRGETKEPRFRPLLQDLRALSRSIGDQRSSAAGVPWTPARLKQLLRTELMGERLVVIANREPYMHVRSDDGTVRVLHPASGLVTALEPVMRACSGVWIAHGSGNADRESVDASDHVQVPPDKPQYTLRRLWLNAEEEKGYYYGFANEGLWPLCHIAHVRPTFRQSDFEHYRAVNRRFADAVVAEAGSDDPIVLVQDYHFALAPRMIRERLPKASIITFWHIPWPNAERMGICPWARELLDGMLGSSILGFHTRQHCNNFLESADRYLESRIDRETQGVEQGGNICLVRPYPISIEWPLRWPNEAPTPTECRRVVFERLGLPAHAKLGVGVDRLDYTKGILERFHAVERALDRYPELRGVLCFAQLSAPSRSLIGEYQDFDRRVLAEAERINARYATDAYRPILMLRAHHEQPAVLTHYRAADFCFVSSLHDGMNLVAKEFVASREDERGVLILSSFTGASKELSEALVVNPYDVERCADAIALAVSMPEDEQRARMHALRSIVAEFNVYAWAGRMLADAARLRWHERIADRLSPFPRP
ncbi:MAG: trehalose-6-phosphate synthase [Planctomycetes bacterium]|nr:trehalose-6-phosphate synthase [Planctomycetota bacterium]MCC7171449.1 trehalose-6-phosphate synthase [Planctomycetota bacterium]